MLPIVPLNPELIDVISLKIELQDHPEYKLYLEHRENRYIRASISGEYNSPANEAQYPSGLMRGEIWGEEAILEEKLKRAMDAMEQRISDAYQEEFKQKLEKQKQEYAKQVRLQ